MLACYSLLPWVREDKAPAILDACTGYVDPFMSGLAAARGYRLTVCDVAPQEPGVDKQDFAAGLTYKDKAFRGVVSSDTLEHLEDMDAALRELRRVTETGGFLVLCLPVCFLDAAGNKRAVTERAQQPDPMHHIWRPGRDVEPRIEAVGYRIVARLESVDFKRMHLSMVWCCDAC